MNPTTSPPLTDLLTEEHRLIKRAVVVLARLCALARLEHVLPESAPEQLLGFVREYADAHHHEKEEGILFPWMERHGFPHEAGPVAVMLHEHGEARAHVAAMTEAVENARRGSGGAEPAWRFIEHGEAYALLLWQHIWKEDTILYPMADQTDQGTAGLHEPSEAEADVQARNTALVEQLEALAESWPAEDIVFREGCH